MIVAPEITRRFDLASGDLQRLDSRIRDYVMSLCNDCGYAWVGRRKTLVSTAEKIESGRFRAWRDVDDLIAYTIVVPTAMEVPDVLQDLEKRFHKIVIRDGRKTIKAPDVFRFDATRFIGKIDVSPLPEQDASLGDLAFEVQVRTAFEHAWSVTTHALAYKAGMVDWRRQRLAAQLKAAIEQLDALIIGFESATGNVVAQHWPVTACRSKIEDHFRRLLESGVLPSEAAPESWERFSWNMLSLLVASLPRRPRDDELEEAVTERLDKLSLALGDMTEESFPRSLSLTQVVIGVLAARGYLSRGLYKYTPLITPELRSLFPAVAVLANPFDFQHPSSP